MKNRGYPTGREEFMEKKFPEKRWVRFGKRTHREGVFEAFCPLSVVFWARFLARFEAFRFAQALAAR
jgi:hypothetical protein